MNAGRVLKEARRRAGLTQRELAHRAGVGQPMIARIERGMTTPRVDTLDRLLEVCGEGLYAMPRRGIGVDRTLAREMLDVEPERRSWIGGETAHDLYAARSRMWAHRQHAMPATVREGRPPTRWPAVVEVLGRHRVRYVVIGGWAAMLQGAPVVSYDMDICYARDDENLERLAAALREIEAYPRGAPRGLPYHMDARMLRNGDVFTLDTVFGAVDCLGFPSGSKGFDELERNATETEVAGYEVKVAAVADLIRMKLAAGRPKDLLMVEELAALSAEIDAREKRGKDSPAE